MSADIAATRALTGAPFGVNVFAVTPTEADAGGARGVPRRGSATGAGEPRTDDDAFAEKVERLLADPVPVVSFTFGCPEPRAGRALPRRRQRGVGHGRPTSTRRARPPRRAPTRSSCRASRPAGTAARSSTRRPGDYGLLALLQLVAAAAPGAAARGHGRDRDRRAPSPPCWPRARPPRRSAPRSCAARRPARRRSTARRSRGPGAPRVTRAFTGRSARGIVNAFMREHERRGAARLPRRAPRDGAAARPRARAGRRRSCCTCGRARRTS